jgi:hypothetical protein
VKRRGGGFGGKVGGAHDASKDAKFGLGYAASLIKEVETMMYSIKNT